MKKKSDYYGEVLTVPELCCFLQIGKNTALKLLNNGTIKGAKVGKGWRVSKTKVIEYLEGVS